MQRSLGWLYGWVITAFVLALGSSVAEAQPACTDANCASCPADPVCAVCNDGFYVTGGGTCSACDSRCGTCSGPNGNDCTSCPAGWWSYGSTCFDNTSTVMPSDNIPVSALPGRTVTRTVQISATGPLTLTVNSVSIVGGSASFFAVGPGTCGSLTPTLEPGASCTFDLSFSPVVAGNYSAQLNIGSNAPPHYVPINGWSSETIPTLSEWGMLAMGLMLAGTMVLSMRRKKA